MITKNPKTSDTRCISKKKVLKMPLKSPKNIMISGAKVREGGRTVGPVGLLVSLSNLHESFELSA